MTLILFFICFPCADCRRLVRLDLGSFDSSAPRDAALAVADGFQNAGVAECHGGTGAAETHADHEESVGDAGSPFTETK